MARTPLSQRYAELVSPVVLSCLGFLVAVWLLGSAVVVVGLGLAILAGFLRDYGLDAPIMAAMDSVRHHPQAHTAIELLVGASAVALVVLVVFYVSVRVLEVLESVARRARKLC